MIDDLIGEWFQYAHTRARADNNALVEIDNYEGLPAKGKNDFR